MKPARIGGQAVIEGVMMKNGDKYAVAVRKPNGEIVVDVHDEYKSIGSKHKGFKLPIIRGVVNFVESLVIGTKTLTFSAEFFEEDENAAKKADEPEVAETVAEIETAETADEGVQDANPSDAKDTKSAPKKESSITEDLIMFGTVALSLCIAVALFMLLPAFIASFIEKYIENHVLSAIIEGVIRLGIFIAYVAAISLMEDIRRVFMYHGAEHKTINCFEAGEELTPENVAKHSRYHKRCGTSFLFVVMIVSIIVFMFITAETLWLKLLLRLILVPVVAGLSYEFIMFAGKSDSVLSNVMSAPGKWVQRLTTKEPDLDMIEVAIKSVEAVIDWRAYQEAMRNGEIEK